MQAAKPRPANSSLASVPREQTLSRRILLTLTPMLSALIVLLVGVVGVTSYTVATAVVVARMAQDARSISSSIPYFLEVGRGLIRDLAGDPRIVTDSGGAASDLLSSGGRSIPFFEQFVVFDAEGQIVASFPDESSGLTLYPGETERVALALAGPYSGDLLIAPGEDEAARMSFVASVANSNGEIQGALLGRASLEGNPLLFPMIETMSASAGAGGSAAILNTEGLVLLDPVHPDRTGSILDFTSTQAISAPGMGEAHRMGVFGPDAVIYYLLPIEGLSEWTVLVQTPNQVALGLASQIAMPLLLVMLLLSLALLFVASQMVRRLTTPIEDLAEAAGLIAQGQLDRPIHMNAPAEIGQLGQAFEAMRQRLKQRLSEQERLLTVSRSVSSSLELYRSMPPILSSALETSEASGARIVLRRGNGSGLQTYAAGEAAAAMATLDARLLDLVERQGTIVISQVSRAAPSLDVAANLPPRFRSLVAFPLRVESSFHGLLWLAYESAHEFEEAELNFLTTLASQAAVAVTNARLFSQAEERRRELEAILSSTADGLIVTDTEGKVALINPAAARMLGLKPEALRDPGGTLPNSDIAHKLLDPAEPSGSYEISGGGGRSLLANTSAIVGQDGAIFGRVTVLRDITALKELDNIKTVFLRMVSHDLRSPLTYMRGYLTMLPLTGDLNGRQVEALQKIQIGIGQISEMTERLTHLSRLRFGEKARLDLLMIPLEDSLSEWVGQVESAAREKSIQIDLEIAEGMPLVEADAVLLRQAIINLVSNAVKYIPTEGRIWVRCYMGVDEDTVTIEVRDNGMGIRAEDQGRLFEAFYRVPMREGETSRPSGSGLGLALVESIALAHNGRVRLESEYGKGATFYFTIPLRQSQPSPQHALTQ